MMDESTQSIANIDLEALGKQQLIEMVRNLNQTLSKLQEDYKKIINLRLYNLERSMNLSQQYLRRDTLEINGIPNSVSDDGIEDEVIEILKEAKVNVNRQNIKKSDVQAAHRKGKKGTVIIKVVNRKFVRAALLSKRNLKGSKRYGDRTALFINDSFIPEFGFFNYLTRRAHKENKIFKYKVRNGVNYVQLEENSKFVEIGHANDLSNIGIEVPPKE